MRSLGQEDSLQESMATHSCSRLENPMDRGAWRAAVTSGVPEEWDTTERLTFSHFQSSPRDQGIASCPFL